MLLGVFLVPLAELSESHTYFSLKLWSANKQQLPSAGLIRFITPSQMNPITCLRWESFHFMQLI